MKSHVLKKLLVLATFLVLGYLFEYPSRTYVFNSLPEIVWRREDKIPVPDTFIQSRSHLAPDPWM